MLTTDRGIYLMEPIEARINNYTNNFNHNQHFQTLLIVTVNTQAWKNAFCGQISS